MGDACTNIGVLKILYFGKLIFSIIKIGVPIGLIIIGMFDFTKAMINNSGDKDKTVSVFTKRLAYAVLIFLVPWIVERFIDLIGSLTEEVKFIECIKNAEIEKIRELEANATDEDDSSDSDSDHDNSNNNNNITYACYLCGNGANGEYKWLNTKSEAASRCSVMSSYKTRSSCLLQNTDTTTDEADTGTGYLTSPLNPNASQQEFIESIKDNSKTLYYLSGSYHGGTDLPVTIGNRVYAMDSGRVYFVQDGCGSYGRHIILSHVVSGRTYYTIYAHLNSIEGKYKTVGMTVNQGDLIGYSGNSYHCTGDTQVGAHLHIGIALDNGQTSKFPQVEGDNSFLVGNFIKTGLKYSIVTSSNIKEYKKCQYC